MAKRPTINTLTNTDASTYLTQLNQNFSNIQAQFDNTLSLDGSLPNAMNADLDLNDFDVINAGTVSADNVVVGGVNLTSVVTQAATSASNSSASAAAALASENAAAVSEANAATSESNAAASESAAAVSEFNAAISESNAYVSELAAALSESNAAASESNAASSESAAASSASNAASSASAASTSESNAASFASAASASADAALAALDSFDDRYLGQKTSDPTLDNDGNPLVAGALYFNTVSDIMKVYDGSIWVAAYASLAGVLVAINNLSDLTNVATARTNLGLAIGTNVQAYDAELAAIAGLAVTDGNFIVGNGTTWVAESGSTARTSLGLGTMATQNSTSVSITGGSLDGTTIGGSMAAAITGTTITGTSATINGNITVTGTVDGRDVSSDGSKLDGIEAGADVTDTTNVTAAGALMDSELANITAVKALNQGVATTDSPTFVGITTSGDVTIADKIVHSGDTNTSIRFPAADTVAVETGGVERLRVDSSGQLGVGTGGTVSAQLHVNSGLANLVGLFESTDAGATLTVIDNSTTGGSAAEQGFNTVGDQLEIRAVDNLAFETAATERIRVTSAGNVGIGNTAPITPLHVTGATVTTGVVYKNQPAQTSKAAAATLTITELLTGIIQYTGAAANLTLPTGTDIEGGLPATFPTNMSFDVSVINTGSGTATVVTNTGLTLVGLMTVAAASSGLFRVRKTATNTYTIYRIAS